MVLMSSKILVVDDDKMVTQTIRRLLEAQGHQVVTDSSNEDLYTRVLSERPDLVIVDIYLDDSGEMQGTKLCKAIKEDSETKSLPVILLTGYCDPAAVLAAQESGTDEFLAKPFDIEDLLGRINRLLPPSLRKNDVDSERLRELKDIVRESSEKPEVVISGLKPPRILVIEDSADVLIMITRNLTPEGFSIFHADNAELGWKKIHDDKPELILLDIKLGEDNSGLDLCRKIKSTPATKKLPVIVLTGTGNIDMVIAARQAGSDDFITKPFEPEELAKRIRILLKM